MASMPMVGARVPESWKLEIDEIAAATGRKSSQVIHEAIALYLNKGTADTLAHQVKDLLQRINALEERHRALAILVANAGR